MATERFIPIEARYEGERALEAVPHTLGHTWGSAHANTLTTATARSSTDFTGSTCASGEAVRDGGTGACELDQRLG